MKLDVYEGQEHVSIDMKLAVHEKGQEMLQIYPHFYNYVRLGIHLSGLLLNKTGDKLMACSIFLDHMTKRKKQYVCFLCRYYLVN